MAKKRERRKSKLPDTLGIKKSAMKGKAPKPSTIYLDGKPVRIRKAKPRATRPRIHVPERFADANHPELSGKLREIGESLRRLPIGDGLPLLRAGEGYHDGKVAEYLSTDKIFGSNKAVGTSYRDIHDEQDEILSTSSFRELVRGLVNTAGLSADKQKSFSDVLEEVSKLRFPTIHTGYSLAEGSAQHPAQRETAIFDDPYARAREHRELDLDRRRELTDAMDRARGQAGATVTSVIAAGMRSVIEYTLNEFLAPATAADVAPFTRPLSDVQRETQTGAREHLKAILEALGGTWEKGPAELTRDWAGRRGKRSASPPRFKELPATSTVSLAETSTGAARESRMLASSRDREATPAGARTGRSRTRESEMLTSPRATDATSAGARAGRSRTPRDAETETSRLLASLPAVPTGSPGLSSELTASATMGRPSRMGKSRELVPAE